ncbi:HPr family phosphocarrier protein [Guyparkeria hydrothermalis]|uniref:HPr family phosphocarrier protein n=1 Tax=Guyparkeria hydrothermalis TaxID=923 RepID=UPI002020DF2F|nr:HPr family phosphocarrier protein [Guyparkeria hydrothermalis]MCL7744061.1 HPr family phosphocarrier protein [Guyparkeria hydrothermalis]
MNDETSTASISRDLTLRNRRGLHARAAARFAATAERFDSDIEVAFNGRNVNGKSIMGLMMLAAACGKTITVTVTGGDANEALDEIADLVDARFHESE